MVCGMLACFYRGEKRLKDQMSTPAKKGRQKQQSGRSEKQTEKQTGKDEEISSYYYTRSVDQKKKELVTNWLGNSQFGADKKSSDDWNKCLDKSFENPFEEASEINETIIENKSCESETVFKVGDYETDSIILGGSAMSTCSSYDMKSKERKLKKEKAMASINGRQPIETIVNDHEENSQMEGARPRRTSGRTRHGSVGSSRVSADKDVAVRSENSKYESALSNGASQNGDTSETDGEQRHEESENEAREIEENPEETAVKILEDYKIRLEKNDSTVFYDMFTMLIMKMATIETSISTVREQQDEVSNKVKNLETAMSYQSNTTQEMDDDLTEASNANIKLIQATIKCEQSINSIGRRVMSVEKMMTKGCFTISGLRIANPGKVKEEVTTFLKTTMHTGDVKVGTAYKMGKDENATIWFKLEDPNDAFKVYKGKAHLRKLDDGRKIYVNDFQTEAEREKEQRVRDLLRENHSMPISHQMQMKRQRGELTINGEPYKKQVSPPSCKDMLVLSKARESELTKNKDVIEGDQVNENGSAFFTYVANVKSWEEVREAYNVVKLKNISATTVMCGYRIFGISYPNLQDYSDDGEYGGGRCILEVLKSNKVWNIAVFVVRYHDGPNLGVKRFQVIRDIVKNSLAGYRKPLNYGRNFRDKQLLKAFEQIGKKTTEKDEEENGESAPAGEGT